MIKYGSRFGFKMSEINGSTLKRFLAKSGLRSKPATIEALGVKLSEYADKLVVNATNKAKADKRKTIFPEDLTMEETKVETPVETIDDAVEDTENSEEQD